MADSVQCPRHYQTQVQPLSRLTLAQPKAPSQRQGSTPHVSALVRNAPHSDVDSRTGMYTCQSAQAMNHTTWQNTKSHPSLACQSSAPLTSSETQRAIYPPQTLYHPATSYPANAYPSSDQPLPRKASTQPQAAMPPDRVTRKKRTGLKHLSYFLRSFGKSINAASTAPTTTQARAEVDVNDTTGKTVCATLTDAQLAHHHVPTERPSMVTHTPQKPCIAPNTATPRQMEQPLASPHLRPRHQLRKHRTVETLHEYRHSNASHGLRRHGSLQTLRYQSSADTLASALHCKSYMRRHHTMMDVGDILLDDNNGSDETIHVLQQDIAPALDNKYDHPYYFKRTEKRLSGGHLGCADELIYSTHPQMVLKNNNNGQDTKCNMTDATCAASEKQLLSQREPDESRCSTHSTISARDEEGDRYSVYAADTARRIWEEDETVYDNMEHIAEWIGSGKPSTNAILRHYLSYFDFSHCTLDEAFRSLCGKLHLKAETQQIDRILEAFAARYWQCNPQCLFGHPDVLHAVVYSLLLLNTDLHVAQGDHKKMARSAFVRNTMSAVQAQLEQLTTSAHTATSQQQNQSVETDTSGTPRHGEPDLWNNRVWQSEMEHLLRELYMSVRHHEVRNPSTEDKTQPVTNTQARRSSLQIAGSRVGALKRGVGTLMWKAARESMFVHELLESEREYPVPPSPHQSTLTPSSASRRRSISSFKSTLSHQSLETQGYTQVATASTVVSATTSYQAVASLLSHSEIHDPHVTGGAPYYKEGLVKRKHLFERAGQKARHREWKECYIVVDRGDIRMYKLDQGHSNGNRKRMPRTSAVLSRVGLSDALSGRDTTADLTEPMGGSDWIAHAQLIGHINLKHTLSNALPSGYGRQRPYTFALQESNGGVFLFEVGSVEEVLAWVSTCNYWAARESKEPLKGGVSSLEYGWGDCLDHVRGTQKSASFPPVTIHAWKPPEPPTMSSTLDERQQLNALRKHMDTLHVALDAHHDVKEAMQRRFGTKTAYGTQAMVNWENKTQYLLHEIIKYQNYCDAIERSLALQAKVAKER